MRGLASLLAVLLLVFSGIALAPTATANHEAVAFVSSASALDSGAPFSWSHTGVPIENGLLIVALIPATVGAGGPTVTVTSVTAGGFSLQQSVFLDELVASGDSEIEQEVWFLLGAERLTSPFTVTVSVDAAQDTWITGASATFNFVDQDNPLLSTTASAINGGPASVTVASLYDTNLVFDFLYVQSTAPDEPDCSIDPPTRGAGQTTEWFQNGPNFITGTEWLLCGSYETGGGSVVMDWDLSNANAWRSVGMDIQSVSDSSGGGGGGVALPRAPAGLEFSCPSLTDADWLLPTTQAGARSVTLYDFRSEAVLVNEYFISWGDGKVDIVGRLPANHTYAKEDVYVITMRLVLRTGGVDVFVTRVDVRGNNCALQMFAQDLFGPLLGLAALALVVAIILTAKSFRHRLDPRKRGTQRIQKGLLGTTLLSFGIVLATAVYATIIGTPI